MEECGAFSRASGPIALLRGARNGWRPFSWTSSLRGGRNGSRGWHVSLIYSQRGVGVGQGGLRKLNDQGGRLIANIVARSSGIRAKDAPAENDGGLLMKTYICKVARRISTSAVFQKWGLYNGAIGEAAEIVIR